MRIAFTSCMDASKVPSQPVWLRIRDQDPDFLLLLGDSIYMDWGVFPTKWRQFVRPDGTYDDKALAELGAAMHARYAAQAAVPEFRQLLAAMHDKAAGGPPRVLLTWDDHDFAWNNSEGAHAPADPLDGRHFVPDAVKAVSRALFEQFRDHILSDLEQQKDYPMPPAPATGMQSGIETFGAIGLPGGPALELAMLDTRWYRTARGAPTDPGRTLLGPKQLRELSNAVQRPAGLLLVAGGSPIEHTYSRAEQDWTGPDDTDAFIDYRELVLQARRPVLYLSGDIHRVRWSGRIGTRVRDDCPVLQALASPAAIGSIGPKHFPAGFGIVRWLPASGEEGRVDIQLHELSKDGRSIARTVHRDAIYQRDRWVTKQLDGEAAAATPYLDAGHVSDDSPIAALVALKRTRPGDGPLGAPVDLPAAIDDAYQAEPPIRNGWPEPMRASVRASGTERVLQLDPIGSLAGTDALQTLMPTLIREAFQRALMRKRRGIAFFIHGLRKSPADAIDEGFALRELYGVEPIVFCWPAGWGGGLIASYIGAFNARSKGDAVLQPLLAALKTFRSLAQVHRDELPSVLVARSAGAVLLDEALRQLDVAQVAGLTAPLERILLSAPGLDGQAFARSHGCPFLQLPFGKTVVTVNQNDRTLKLSRFVQPGDCLGRADPSKAKLRSNAVYLDFTHSQGVGQLHDYLLLQVSGPQRDVHARVLTGRGDLDLLAMEGVRQVRGPNVFEVA